MPDMRSKTGEFSDACNLEATVSTTGFCGGDSGHGGRTEILFKDLGSTDIEAEYNEQRREVAIRLRGDAELKVIIEALRFAANSLEDLAYPDEARAKRKIESMADTLRDTIENGTAADRYEHLSGTLTTLMYQVNELKKARDRDYARLKNLESEVRGV